ncbi:four-disulfide core domain 18-like isoform X2 [Podarcis lilfordi]|uniref:Four-disulfide core domain 18-like isoform X2 n=1 Tax=Podarcis lilfordi TaxID=74358 RepID=A0AA35KI93_9SAUR|nr:four-disulfide core domain 18-like isoform X2 [Podarcis lilfordi]
METNAAPKETSSSSNNRNPGGRGDGAEPDQPQHPDSSASCIRNSTMKASLFLVFFLMGLLTICVELPSAAGQVHPGRCPRPTGPGVCAELCQGDASCSPGEKCCSNGCGHQCMRAIKG